MCLLTRVHPPSRDSILLFPYSNHPRSPPFLRSQTRKWPQATKHAQITTVQPPPVLCRETSTLSEQGKGGIKQKGLLLRLDICLVLDPAAPPRPFIGYARTLPAPLEDDRGNTWRFSCTSVEPHLDEGFFVFETFRTSLRSLQFSGMSRKATLTVDSCSYESVFLDEAVARSQ